MISISKCPLTGLDRKVEYDFHWFSKMKQIIIECSVRYFKDMVEVDSARIKSYKRNLVASDSLVRNDTGQVLTPEQITAYNRLLTDIETYPIRLAQYELSNGVGINGIPIDEPIEPMAPAYQLMLEYGFYAYVLGVTPIILPNLIMAIILQRDIEGKFDI